MPPKVLLLAVLFVAAVPSLLAEAGPYMACYGVGLRWFTCELRNIPKHTIDPDWRVFSSPLSYSGRGGYVFSFPTPAKWSVIDMRFDYGEVSYIFRKEVRRGKGKVQFRAPIDLPEVEVIENHFEEKK